LRVVGDIDAAGAKSVANEQLMGLFAEMTAGSRVQDHIAGQGLGTRQKDGRWGVWAEPANDIGEEKQGPAGHQKEGRMKEGLVPQLRNESEVEMTKLLWGEADLLAIRPPA
jgi:hypothetical protein